MGDTASANLYIGKYIGGLKKLSFKEADIAYNMGDLYSAAAMNDEAEKFYRQALSLTSSKTIVQGNLAWFLIDKDRNIDEGLELIDKVLQANPDASSAVLDTKGWGLYKKGKYKEALVFLEKARDRSPRFYHDAWKHIEAVKKAIANQDKK
jgi:Tfp pilus assembly protein PilF